MQSNRIQTIVFAAGLIIFALATGPAARAQVQTSVTDDTRYLAMGDSISAGFEARPVTQGFTYQLYQSGVIDNLNNLVFCMEAVPGAGSADVLAYQIPQVHLFFGQYGTSYRKVVTLTVGGNDLLSVVGADGTVNQAQVPVVLNAYGNNLAAILGYLAANFPDAKVYVGNAFDPKLPVAGENLLVAALNQVTASVASLFPNTVVLVDVFSAFEGRNGLLQIEKKGAGIDIHPTNAGYQVMTKAFADAIKAH